MKIQLIISLYSENPAEPSFAMLRGLFPVCPTCSEPGLDVLLPAPGIILQLITPGAQPPDFFKQGTVISYAVDDLSQAITIAIAEGAEVLQEYVDECSGFAFCYLRLGKVFGLFC